MEPPRSLPPALAELVEQLRTPRNQVIASVLATVAQFVYQRYRNNRRQLKLRRSLLKDEEEEEDSTASEVEGDEEASEPKAAAALAKTMPPVMEWYAVAPDGVEAQSLVYYPLDDPDQDLLILIVPGNPGVSFFMVPLMRELAKHYDRRYEVRCFAQSGHVANEANSRSERTFLLEEHIQHKLYYVRNPTRAFGSC